MKQQGSTHAVRGALPFFLPEGLVLLAGVAFLRPGGLPLWALPLIQAYAYVLLVGGLVIGWYTKRTRIFWSGLLLVLVDRALETGATLALSEGLSGRTMFEAVALLLPLNFLGFSLLSDRPHRTAREAFLLLLILLEGCFAGWISMPAQSEIAGFLETAFVDRWVVAWSSLPQPALLTFGLAMALLTVRFAWTGNRIDKGFVWALAASFIAFQYLQHGWNATNYLATASLLLIVATYAETHRGSYYDTLTAMPGRNALDQALYDPGKRYAVALVSIDRLKEINLQYGYMARDEAVRWMATRLTGPGKSAQAFRYADESFALLFHDRGVAEVLPELERIRERVQSSPMVLPKRLQPLAKPEPGAAAPQPGQGLSLTVSIGVAERGEKAGKSHEVLAAAEKQLLRAKRGGGNQVKTEGQRDSAMGVVGARMGIESR
jgi:diguanylate cyclase (GGDEF)-like protein